MTQREKKIVEPTMTWSQCLWFLGRSLHRSLVIMSPPPGPPGPRESQCRGTMDPALRPVHSLAYFSHGVSGSHMYFMPDDYHFFFFECESFFEGRGGSLWLCQFLISTHSAPYRREGANALWNLVVCSTIIQIWSLGNTPLVQCSTLDCLWLLEIHLVISIIKGLVLRVAAEILPWLFPICS